MLSTSTQNLPKNARVIHSKFYPHEAQQKIKLSPARFKIVKAGRRFGKSVFAVNECIEYAIKKPNQKVWFIAPLYRQAKEIAWNLFSEFLPKEFIHKKNESELSFHIINGSEISLKGADNADSLVGVGLNFVVLDEAAIIKSDVWYHIVRPMLVDTKGSALFIGTPRGFNWLHDLWVNSKDDKEFDRFEFTTIDNTAIKGIAEEVEKARKEAKTELDKVIFRQEYEATFEVITGRPRFDLEVLRTLNETAVESSKEDGLLKIFREPDKYSQYVIGADTSEGLITGDRSACVIINSKTYEVEAYYAGFVAPDIFAHYLSEWGRKYNEAKIVVEDNNHGLATLNELKTIYKNLYYRKVKDEITDEWTEKLGWRTTPRTKPLLISNLDKSLRNGLKVPQKEILDELMTYVVMDDGGTEASEGSRDDLVIATACAVQGYVEMSEHEIAKPKEETKMYTPAWIQEQRQLAGKGYR